MPGAPISFHDQFEFQLTHVESAPLGDTMELSKSHGTHQGAAIMKRTTKYVALDVHQATTTSSVREGSGRVIARSVLPTEATALVEYFSGMRGSIYVAFEEGTQAQWLHDLLVPVVDRGVVCDRRGEPRSGNKADRVDADRLSRLLLNGMPARGLPWLCGPHDAARADAHLSQCGGRRHARGAAVEVAVPVAGDPRTRPARLCARAS